MKQKDITALLDEPIRIHPQQGKQGKSGCAKPKPGATAGSCAFDGAQIALLPIADVAHSVHGSIACVGNSWDNRGTRFSGPSLYKIGMATDLTEQDAMLDPHFMLGMSRFALAADADLLVGFSDLPAAMGAETVAAGAPSNAAALRQVRIDRVKVGDLEDLERRTLWSHRAPQIPIRT